MKTISVSVDEKTHRLARIRAAETGTTVSAMMRDMLLEMLNRPATPTPAETEPERRARLLDEVLERFRKEGIGVDTSQLMTREELYDRYAAR
jgi:plasmid stability protein